jgi:shikimate dehydrogenase
LGGDFNLSIATFIFYLQEREDVFPCKIYSRLSVSGEINMPEGYPVPVSAASCDANNIVRCGLLGSNVSSSLSPAIHSIAAAQAGINLEYQLINVSTEEELAAMIKKLHEQNYAGLNITMPFKMKLEHQLIGMSPEAISAGSVNLLLRHAEGWIGENTDVEGFIRPLAARRLHFESILLIGAGGAARAAMQVLAGMPFVKQIFLLNRDVSKAESLKEEYLIDSREIIVLDNKADYQIKPDLVVNATPMGMTGFELTNLACPESWISPGSTCFDMVYSPHWTPFLTAAVKKNASVIHGIEMLVYQARRAFEGWTGKSFDSIAVLEEYLKARA